MVLLTVCVPGVGEAGGGTGFWGHWERVYIFFSVIAQVQA